MYKVDESNDKESYMFEDQQEIVTFGTKNVVQNHNSVKKHVPGMEKTKLVVAETQVLRPSVPSVDPKKPIDNFNLKTDSNQVIDAGPFEHTKPRSIETHDTSNSDFITFQYAVTKDTEDFAYDILNALNVLMTAVTMKASFKLTIDFWLKPSISEYLSNSYIENSPTEIACSESDNYPTFNEIIDSNLTFVETMKKSNVLLCLHQGKTWKQYENEMQAWENFTTTLKFLHLKSNITQNHFWNLTTKYQTFVDTILSEYPAFSTKDTFISLQIHRPTSALKNTGSTSVLKYYEMLLKTLRNNFLDSALVLVYSEDDSAMEEFKDLVVNKQAQTDHKLRIVFPRHLYAFIEGLVNEESTVIADSEIYVPEEIDLADEYENTSRGWIKKLKTPVYKTEEHEKFIRDNILFASLTRYSDYVIGSMKSDAFKLAAILRINYSFDTCIAVEE